MRHCWDHAYNGAGNWSFNTAYAARFGLGAFVTRLRGLAEAEAFIAAGIPLIASVRVDPAELTGSEYTSAGHLVVIVGFTDEGDVIVNDPDATPGLPARPVRSGLGGRQRSNRLRRTPTERGAAPPAQRSELVRPWCCPC